jgi:hypothetical protein
MLKMNILFFFVNRLEFSVCRNVKSHLPLVNENGIQSKD